MIILTLLVFLFGGLNLYLVWWASTVQRKLKAWQHSAVETFESLSERIDALDLVAPTAINGRIDELDTAVSEAERLIGELYDREFHVNPYPRSK